jgi:hypothetical protein
MNTNVQITLSSTDPIITAIIPNLKVLGASISYGINRLPVAQVDVDPSGLQTFCDFDNYRRRDLTVTIKTGGLSYDPGCLQFNGWLDGVNISQHPGSLSSALIIKHKFVLLNEIYPRILGLNAGTANMFTVQQPVTYEPNQFGPASANTQFLTSDLPLYGIFSGPQFTPDLTLPIIPFIIQLFKIVVVYQATTGVLQVANSYLNIQNALGKVIEAQQINANNLLPVVKNLLNQINTSYTSNEVLQASNTLLSAGSPTIACSIISAMSGLDDTVLNSMIRFIGQYGSTFVVGNKTAFVVPEAAYLQVTIDPSLLVNKRSIQRNVAYPADYDSFNFNDNGENTIKGVYVVPDTVGLQGTWAVGGVNVLNGYYIDPAPNTLGNIVVKTLPQLAESYVSRIVTQGSMAIQTNIKNGDNLITKKVETEEATDNFMANKSQILAERDNILSFLNAWAQGEYCRIKYGDRVGSISMPFNNNWTPGAPGAAYTNHPGTWVHFYVTEVSHSFQVTPGSGNASTNVNFNGGRPGKSISSGLTSVPLYNYTYANSQDFCNHFVTDISPS